MSKIKRVICLLCVFVMTTAFVTGCALFERDIDYYNSMIVASVGANIKITKGQLISAYNNYGSKYVSEQGLSEKEAIEKTLDDLIDREILVELSISSFSYGGMSEAGKAAHINSLRGKTGMASLYYDALYENEKAEVRKRAFDAVDEYYLQLQGNVRDEMKYNYNSPTDATDPNIDNATAAMDPFAAFQRLVNRNDSAAGNSANTIFSMDISSYVNKEVYSAPQAWSPEIDADGDSIANYVKTQALSRLVSSLTNREKGMRGLGISEKVLVDATGSSLTEGECAVIGREIGRMIEDYSKTLLVNRFQEVFDLGIDKPIDRSHYTKASEYEDAVRAAAAAMPANTGRADTLAMQARSFYRSKVLSQYNRFVKELDTAESLESKIFESLEDIYWLPKEIAENNFTVSHILIQYNDAQKAELEEIKTLYASGGMTASEYNLRINALAAKISVRARDEKGIEYGDPVSAVAIRNEIEAALGGNTLVNVPQIDGTQKEILVPASSGAKSEQERISIFRDFIYKYNQDPGMNNASYEYLMGINNSKMVESFTDASRELFGYMKVAQKKSNGEPVLDENKKPVYDWVKRDGTGGRDLFTPVRSSMTYDLVMSEYGAHIVMYTSKLGDFIYNTNVNKSFIDFASFESDLTSMLDNRTAKNYLFAPLNSYGNVFGEYLQFGVSNKITANAKTMFDVVIEKLNQPAFDSKRKSLVLNFKLARVDGKEDGDLVNPIKIYKGNYKDLI